MEKPTKPELKRLYYDRELSQTEIADRFDTYQRKVSLWMEDYDISPGKRTDLAADAVRVNRATFTHQPGGYEAWRARDGDTLNGVLVHRLAAVAWFGLDTVKQAEVHHANGIPWDNREQNLKPLSISDHRSLHADEQRRDANGRFARKDIGRDLADD